MKPTSKVRPYQSIDTCSHGFESVQLAQIIENYTESLTAHKGNGIEGEAIGRQNPEW